MRRLAPGTRAVITVLAAAMLVGAGLAPSVAAQSTPDRSEVVLVLDFSASILEDAANRNRFGAALERIADRVDATTADLVAGDARLSIVQFATRAADYPGCADLRLLGSAPTVARFANCLRSVAGAYRKGLSPALTRKIGVDTNYVAAMEQAAKHLPPDAVRPTLILFTDGKHDVRGVPVSRVRAVRDRLFGSRTPFALLPVGMGLDPKKRDALAAGLGRLQIIKDMPACVSGTAFAWPRVVFKTPGEAATAVAVALQDATCTFTVAPTPTPTPAPTPGVVQAIRLTAGDGRIVLTWAAPRSTQAPISDYRARCRAGDGDWIESKEGVSLEPRATIQGLANGTAYDCEVAAIGASSAGTWTAATTPATPMARPPAPGKPSVEALDRAVRVSVAPRDGAGLSGYRYECSPDRGGTWPAGVDVSSANATVGQVGNLTNGVSYICRAFAENLTGQSDASPTSDAVTPCGSLFECNPAAGPIAGILGFLALGGLLVALVVLYRQRRGGYVVAVVDVVHIANLGRGSRLGIGFIRSPVTKRVTGIVADRGPKADIRIRQLSGGRFEVIDRVGRHVTAPGEPVLAADAVGARHELILRAFATKAASPVSSAR
jgi:Fibronectin type III domain